MTAPSPTPVSTPEGTSMDKTLNDLAPYPQTEEQVTAEALALHMAAEGHALASRSLTLRRAMKAAEGTEGHADKAEVYALNASAVTADYAVAKLLTLLAGRDPELADTAAKAIWVYWEDGSSVNESLWHMLRQGGIDPDQVAALAKAEQEKAA